MFYVILDNVCVCVRGLHGPNFQGPAQHDPLKCWPTPAQGPSFLKSQAQPMKLCSRPGPARPIISTESEKNLHSFKKYIILVCIVYFKSIINEKFFWNTINIHITLHTLFPLLRIYHHYPLVLVHQILIWI